MKQLMVLMATILLGVALVSAVLSFKAPAEQIKDNAMSSMMSLLLPSGD